MNEFFTFVEGSEGTTPDGGTVCIDLGSEAFDE
jgi:hypothetical protein